MSLIIQPRINATLTRAEVAVGNTPQRVLFVGPRTSAGSAATGSLVQNIGNEGQESDFWGSASQIASSIRAFKKINPLTSVDGIGITDTGGFAAFQVALVATPATKSGVVTLEAGGGNSRRYTVSVAVGDTNATVRDALVALVNADPYRLFDASALAAGTMNLQAVNAGAQASGLGVEIYGTDVGISTGATVTRTSTGAVEPATTSVLDVIGDQRYQAIVWGFTDVTAPVALLDARFNVDNKIVDGVCFSGFVGTHANALTLLGGASYNSNSLVVFFDQDETETNYRGPSVNEPWFDKIAQFAAVRSLRLTKGANISQYLTSQSSLDQFGGTALASLPYFNTPFPSLPVAKTGRGFTDTQIESLFTAGGSLIGSNATGDAAISGEVVTTYKTDAAGNPDPTWQFLNAVDTMSNAREYIVNNWRKRFAQSRLTTGAAVRGRSMVNGPMFRAYTEGLYSDLTGPDFVLGVGGEDALNYFKDNLTVEITMSTGTITTTMSFPMVVGMREILATIRVSFSTEG